MTVELVTVTRSGVRESVHRGSVVLLAPDGRVARSVGDVTTPMFPRSSAKPAQAVAMLRCGVTLTDPELALTAASHNGEPQHVSGVRAMLRRGGLTTDDLRCPSTLPLYPPAARVLLASGGEPAREQMNCSGKHAGMLLTCRHRGWPTDGYPDPTHPLQQRIRSTIGELAGELVTAAGVDGCGAPVFSISLVGLARTFARLVTAEPGSPQRRVADVMREHPFLVGGTAREDTLLMQAVDGLLCKAGAEGVHAGALPDGSAFAFKIDDGATRARLPVTVAALASLGMSCDELRKLGDVEVLGGGVRVGTTTTIAGVLD